MPGVTSWTKTTPTQATRTQATPPAALPPELPRPATGTSRGVLRPDDGSGRPQSSRYQPSAAVGTYVEHYWTVRWDHPAPATRAVLGHPAIHITVEHGDGSMHDHDLPAALVHGVVRRTFAVDLTPSGWVFGARFRPGGFTALTGLAASAYTDRVVAATDVFADAAELRDAILASDDDTARGAAFNAWLTPRLPDRVEPGYDELVELVTWILADRSVQRADDVAAAAGCSLRTLQRRFERSIGVGPKWLITRYRLHDALAAIDGDTGDEPIDLAGLAASLGWFDQAHFTRDFTAHVGVSPQAYRARPR